MILFSRKIILKSSLTTSNKIKTESKKTFFFWGAYGAPKTQYTNLYHTIRAEGATIFGGYFAPKARKNVGIFFATNSEIQQILEKTPLIVPTLAIRGIILKEIG